MAERSRRVWGETIVLKVVDEAGVECDMECRQYVDLIRGRLSEPNQDLPGELLLIGDEKFKELGKGAFQSLTSEKLVWDKRVARKP